VSERPRRVALRTETIKGKLAEIGPSHSDHAGWLARLQNAFGTTSQEFACDELTGIATALASPGQKTADEGALNAALAVVDGIEPRNEVEAMLASQMAVTHALALDFLARTKRAETWKAFDCAGTLATKLQRTFIAQVEALAEYRRGKGTRLTG